MRGLYRILLILLILLMWPQLLMAIDKKKTRLIVPGRWKETVRMRPDSTVMPFIDTLLMHFMVKDSFTYRNGNGFLYEGVFRLSEDSILDLGTARYKVLLRNTEQMVLINQTGIFKLVPDKSDTLKAIVLKKEDSTRPVTNIDQMIGRWSVYKRTMETAGTLDPAVNIRSAFITGASTDGKQGFIYSGQDPDSKPSWYITELGGGQSLNCAGTSNRTLKVLRCQDREMILEENGVKYYMKLYR